MEVHKFGGASIATPERMVALLPVIQHSGNPRILVVSAIGKTTNALEAIVAAACSDEKENAHKMVRAIEQQHLEYARTILDEANYKGCVNILNVYFTELQWGVDDADASRYDYSYDQIVCLGEILATRIFSCYLEQEGFAHAWIDIRDVIRTDDTYRDARVDVAYSTSRASRITSKYLQQGISIVTQGFIGATADNASVTLGREGSDYTAALLAAMLDAESVTIWKDVEGLQNADPKLFPDTVKVPAITYHEVIEMAYYGAQVIHPKTIKPLQNNNIPLYVKCFLSRELPGTVIQNIVNDISYPPLIVLKEEQILVQITTRDFSFITEDNLRQLYSIFYEMKIKVNLIQNAAISFVACIDNKPDKVEVLKQVLGEDYKVFTNDGVSLLTIRHYTPEILSGLTRNKYILLEQKTRQTVQVVMK